MVRTSLHPRSLACAGRILTGLALAAWLSGCGHSSLKAEKRESTADGSSVPRTREADDVARFLAGLPGTPQSPYADLETSQAWQTHRRRLDEAWRKADFVAGLMAFQRKELSEDPAWAAPVFYPFGGPEVLTVSLLFPQSPVCIIVGLEPAGTLPTFRQIETMDLPKYLTEIRATMASELGRSFFITHDMDRQFRGQITDGLLLPILQLLVRTHHRVLGFRYVRLDEDGKIVERAATYKALTRFGNKGTEIEYETDSDSSVHTLYYFSVNLSNERLAENKPFLRYLSHLSDVTTFLKATSYMIHLAAFSMIRDGVLAKSATILQDDSGIPYSFFRPESWKVQLFGEYTRPYGTFRWMEQPALRKAYREARVKPLSMHLGYGYAKIGSDLLLARRTRN
ncbi:MAG: hypothetical protein ABSB35_31210 [Bryobacteraceae bacterium]